MSYRVGKEAFSSIIQRALDDLPDDFAEAAEALTIEVRDRPTRRMLDEARTPSGQTLLGLYRGRPATRRSVEDSAVLPDVIYLFQREIEAMCNTEDELQEEVRKTLLHEVGHYFGLDEDDLARLGYS